MKKLKWKYYRRERTYIANGEDYRIESFKENRSFELTIFQNKYTIHNIPFKKLSNAKKAAQLIYNG